MNELSAGKVITVRAAAVKLLDIFADGGCVVSIETASPSRRVFGLSYRTGDYGEAKLDNDYALTVTRPRTQSVDAAARLGAHARPPLIDGYSSQAVRFNAPSPAVRWFMTLEAGERGAIVTQAWLDALPALERLQARRDLGLK